MTDVEYGVFSQPSQPTLNVINLKSSAHVLGGVSGLAFVISTYEQLQ